MNLTKVLKGVLSLGLALSSIVCTSCPVYAKANEKVVEQNVSLVYPNVQSYKTSNSKQFKLASETRLFVVNSATTTNNAVLLKDLQRMSSQLLDKLVVDKAPNIVFGSESNTVANDIVIKINDVAELEGKDQSYKITITDKITLEAKDEVGIYYGLITIIQALKANNNTLTQGVILDYPDTAERSLHLDAARKFFPKDWIIALIKDLSWQKYNSVQFHFSENEGFRLESDTLKKINFQYDGNNYLTKQDMLDIIKVANDYHIEIIPSLDSPGHLGKVLQYLDSSYNCSSLFPSDGRRSQCFNIFTNTEARNFLVELMTEFITFFSDAGCKHFNIGGDEFLEHFSNFSNEQYNQIITYFNDISKICKDHGMTPRAWNDGLLYGNYTGYKLDPSIEICYWAVPDNCASIQQFVDNGNRVLNYSDAYMYYVLSTWWQNNACPEGNIIYDQWHTGRFSISKTIGAQTFDKPYPDFVVGSSYAIWCDYANYMTKEEIANNIFYRTRATAYKMWNYELENPPYSEFVVSVDAIGRTPGYVDELPQPGEVLTDSESYGVVLNYIDVDTNEKIECSDTYYYPANAKYEVTNRQFKGYKYIEADQPLQGTVDKNIVINFKYSLHTDKSQLQQALNDQLLEENYIPETYADYKKAVEHAQAIFDDPKSVQSDIDAALENINTAAQSLVKIEYFALYAETKYPSGNYGYGSAYGTYMNLVDEAKAAVRTQNLTEEQLLDLTNRLVAAKNALNTDPSIKPSVHTDINFSGSNRYENMFDNNLGSYCWFASGQNIGDTIDIVFPGLMELSKITITEPDGTDIISQADVLVSEDGKTFTKVGEITSSNSNTEITFEKQIVRTVRIQITKDSKFWYKISEIKFTGNAVAIDNSLRTLLNQCAFVPLKTKSLDTAIPFINAYLEAQRIYASGSADIATQKTELQKAYNALSKKSNGLVDLIAYSVSLEGNTCVNFYFKVTENMKQDPSAYLQFVKENGTVTKYLVKDLKPEDDGLVRIQVPMVAREMNDSITPSLFYTDAKTHQQDILLYNDCSVVSYAKAILDNASNYTHEIIAAVKSMLNFGAQAQRYFNYKEDALANAILPVEDQYVEVDPSVFDRYVPSKSGNIDGLTYLGTSTLLKSDMSVAHYMELAEGQNIDEFTFKVDGQVVQPTQRDGKYLVEVENIYAKNLGKAHVLEVIKGSSKLEVHYSVLSYAYIVMNDETSSQELKDVVSAMYVYNQNALAYAQSVVNQ